MAVRQHTEFCPKLGNNPPKPAIRLLIKKDAAPAEGNLSDTHCLMHDIGCTGIAGSMNANGVPMGDLAATLKDTALQAQVRRRIIHRTPSLQPDLTLPQDILDRLAELDRVVEAKQKV